LLTGGVSYPKGEGGFWHWPSEKRHLWSQVGVLHWQIYAFKQNKLRARTLCNWLFIKVMRDPITWLQAVQITGCVLARKPLITAVPVRALSHRTEPFRVHRLPPLCERVRSTSNFGSVWQYLKWIPAVSPCALHDARKTKSQLFPLSYLGEVPLSLLAFGARHREVWLGSQTVSCLGLGRIQLPLLQFLRAVPWKRRTSQAGRDL